MGRVVFLLLLALALPASARAATSERPRTMTFGEAVAQGAQRGPAVVEATRVASAASAFANDPGPSLPSVPQVSLMAGARQPTGLPIGPEVSLAVQQEIAVRPLGSARTKAAEWAARAATSDVERAKLEGAALAALAWLDLLEAQQLLRVRLAVADDATKLVRIAEARVASGTATAMDRSLAQAELGAANLAILDGEGRATEARIALAHATGASDAKDVLAAEESAPDFAESSPDVAHHPAVLAAEARAQTSLAEGRVAHAAAGPSWFVGAMAWREGSGDVAAAATLGLPLPFFDPARYDTGRQSTVAATAAAHAARLRADLARDVELASHDREHTRERQGMLRDGVVTPLRRAHDTALTAYGAGTTELGVVLLARRASLSAEEQLVSASVDVRRADVRVAALGGSLVRAGNR